MNTQDRFTGARKQANARIGFTIHLLAYLIVNAALIAINLATSTRHFWFLWPLFGWGVGVAAHGLAVYFLTKGRRFRAG